MGLPEQVSATLLTNLDLGEPGRLNAGLDVIVVGGTSLGEGDLERMMAGRHHIIATTVLLVVVADATWGMIKLFPK